MVSYMPMRELHIALSRAVLKSSSEMCLVLAGAQESLVATLGQS
jgi:hypothetical protein